MELFILLAIIVAISTFKSESDKKKAKKNWSLENNNIDEMKKELTKQTNTRKKDEDQIIKQGATKAKVSKTVNVFIEDSINSDFTENYKDTILDGKNIVEKPKDLKVDYLTDLKHDFRVNTKRAFVYSEIFNKKY